MVKKICLIAVVGLLTLNSSFSQDQSVVEEPAKQLVRAGNKTTFGNGPSDVAAYLTEQRIAEKSKIDYKRAAFRLTIDHQGKVTEASRFFGGITPEIEEQLSAAFLRMPVWKTTIEANQLSVVYVVVIVKNQQITTELY